MNYLNFKKYVEENILYYLPRTYKDAKVTVNEVPKQNGIILDGLMVKINSEQKVVPVIYLNDFYEDFLKNNDINNCMFSIASLIKKSEVGMNAEKITIEDGIDKIFFEILSKDYNSHLLNKVPYIEFLDLIVIFRKLVQKDSRGIQSFVITNEMANLMKLDKDKLFEIALENTEKLFPYKFSNMQDIISNIMFGTSPKEIDLNLLELDSKEADNMYILTNDMGINGASAIIYKDLIKTIANKLKKDLFILPSSIHEVIIVPMNNQNLDDLKEMVKEVNGSEVSLSEQLSNNVYKFFRTSGEITL